MGWRAYGNINTINNGVYTHAVINHTENFVDPDNAKTHTQSVENFWIRAKRKLSACWMYGPEGALAPAFIGLGGATKQHTHTHTHARKASHPSGRH